MRIQTLLASVGLLVASQGCIVVTGDDPPPEPTGKLVIDWSIDGVKDAAECYQGDVSTVAITLLTPGGSSLADYEQDCEAFATSIELTPGDYAADVVLLDPDGLERTTPVRLRAFTIYGHDQLDIPVDFPASSFF